MKKCIGANMNKIKMSLAREEMRMKEGCLD